MYLTLEVQNPLGFITLMLQRPGTGFSDLGSVYSHLISVWFRNYFKKMSLLIQDSGNNLFKFFLRKIHATEKHSSRYDFIGFCLRNISVK